MADAFEGFGATTPGGAGGQALVVTNLNEAGPGSLRVAVETPGARIITFAVAGTIDHKAKPLTFSDPNITILGQSAPAGGICLSGEEVRIQTHDVIIQGLRVRTGDVDVPRDGWDNRDAMNFGVESSPGVGSGTTHDIVIDHCSFSWSVDELMALWFDAHDITIQNCIFAEALMYNHHPSGYHSMGPLIGIAATNISFHHNLIANNNQRNPQLAGNLGVVDPLGVVDFGNNVIFNWGEHPLEFEHLGNRANVYGNRAIRGPNTQIGAVDTMVRVANDATDLQLYIARNWDPTLDGRGSVDNWPMVKLDSGANPPTSGHKLSSPLTAPAITEIDAGALVQYMVAHAGAILPKRDSVDQRTIKQLLGQYTGTQTFFIDSPSQVGGWPELADPVFVSKGGADSHTLRKFIFGGGGE